MSRFEPCLLDEVKFGSYQNCGITIWQQTTTGISEAIAKQDELVTHIAGGRPSSVVLCVVICPGNKIPSSAQRKELESHFERQIKLWRAVVMIAEGNDLWSVTARSVMTAMRLVQRRPYPTKICSETMDAAQWAAPHLDDVDSRDAGETAKRLHKAIEDLRATAF